MDAFTALNTNKKYEVKDVESLLGFSKDIKEVYGLEVKHGSNPSGFTGDLIPFVRVRSKMMYFDLMRYGPYDSCNWRVPRVIFVSSKNVRKEFLKVLFDDEGTVHVSKKIVKLYSTNLAGLRQIQSLLQEFGINCKIYSGYGFRRNVYGLVLRGRENLERFTNKIGFGLRRKMSKLLEILH